MSIPEKVKVTITFDILSEGGSSACATYVVPKIVNLSIVDYITEYYDLHINDNTHTLPKEYGHKVYDAIVHVLEAYYTKE